MGIHELSEYFSNKGSRNEVRMRIIAAFSDEDPGTGSGNNASKYIYYVETLHDGKRVYLQRPANLNRSLSSRQMKKQK